MGEKPEQTLSYGGIDAFDTRGPYENLSESLLPTVAGIVPSSRQYLFEPFFTTKGTLGTGLDLWVCKQIVDKHGGSIRLRSSTDEKHRGTVCSIVLPVGPATHRRSAGAF